MLGVWGWLVYRDEHPQRSLDLFAIVHGTWALFSAGGEIERVPWQLAIARVLAPITVAGVAIEIGLVAGAQRLAAAAARRSSGHAVVVGPAGRVGSHLSEQDGSWRPAIHVTDALATAHPRTLVVRDDGSAEGWIESTNAPRARKVALATGSDARNLALLAAALDGGVADDDTAIMVEFDDRALALSLALRLAVERPSTHIDVVGLDDVRAAYVAERVVEAFGRALGFQDARTAFAERDVVSALEAALSSPDGTGQAKVPGVAVVGDGSLSRVLVAHLAAGLTSLASLTGTTRFPLAVVAPGVEDGSQLDTARSTEHRSFLELSELEEWERTRPLIAVVDYADPEETARRAVELSCARPESMIWVVGEDPLLAAVTRADPRDPSSSPGTGITVLSRAAIDEAGFLVGAFTRVSELRNRDAAALPAPDHDAPAGKWSSLWVRTAVQLLERTGWRLRPAVGNSATSTRHCELNRATVLALQELGDGIDDADRLVHYLAQVGIVVERREESEG